MGGASKQQTVYIKKDCNPAAGMCSQTKKVPLSLLKVTPREIRTGPLSYLCCNVAWLQIRWHCISLSQHTTRRAWRWVRISFPLGSTHDLPKSAHFELGGGGEVWQIWPLLPGIHVCAANIHMHTHIEPYVPVPALSDLHSNDQMIWDPASRARISFLIPFKMSHKMPQNSPLKVTTSNQK